MIFEKDENPLKDESIIGDFEERFQKKLPNSYLDLLRIQNGGPTKGLCFMTKAPISLRFGNMIPIYEISGIGKKENGKPWTMEMSDHLIAEWELPNDILLLYGEGHWWIFLDYRSNYSNEPKVSLIDLEFQTDIVLSEDFKTFISSLENIPDDTGESSIEGFEVID